MMKRLYDHVAVTPAAGGVAVELDGRVVKTPARRPLILPNRVPAEAVAGEWEAQKKTIETETMPMMRPATTAIDRVADQRGRVVDAVTAYGATDLLCYRVAEPAALKALQAENRQPLLDWCAARYGARLEITEGIIAPPRDSAAIGVLRAIVDVYDAMALTALHAITGIGGSLVIALALADQRINPATTWRLCRIDEDFQSERRRVDADARTADDRLRSQLFAAARFLVLCKDCRAAGAMEMEEGTA